MRIVLDGPWHALTVSTADSSHTPLRVASACAGGQESYFGLYLTKAVVSSSMPKPSSAHGKQRRPHALGLAKFADAKTSTYDKQARKQKERALNSKVVNKYRKLRARLDGQAGGPHAVQSAPQVLLHLICLMHACPHCAGLKQSQ